VLTPAAAANVKPRASRRAKHHAASRISNAKAQMSKKMKCRFERHFMLYGAIYDSLL
jgi:hypothetical protein